MSYISADLSGDFESDEEYLEARREQYGQPRLSGKLDPFTNGSRPMGRPEALRLLGPVLYATRQPDGLIKIGHTENLQLRLYLLRGELLAFKSGTRADELALHHSLRGLAARGREWYHPADAVLEVVNEWRAALNLEPIAA